MVLAGKWRRQTDGWARLGDSTKDGGLGAALGNPSNGASGRGLMSPLRRMGTAVATGDGAGTGCRLVD